MRQEVRLRITYAATFANLVAGYHAVLAFRRMPTIRLLPLAGLLGGSGSNTLFPVVGAVKVPKSAFFAPVVGVVKLSTAPVGGVALPRLSGGASRFCGGLRRAVAGNLQSPQAP